MCGASGCGIHVCSVALVVDLLDYLMMEYPYPYLCKYLQALSLLLVKFCKLLFILVPSIVVAGVFMFQPY